LVTRSTAPAASDNMESFARTALYVGRYKNQILRLLKT
jgi:hypothetical protein